MKKIFLLILTFPFFYNSWGQADDIDARFIKEIHDQNLKNGKCFDWLRGLTKEVGPRLAGSDGSVKGVNFTKQIMKEMNLDAAWTQVCDANYWRRGNTEKVYVVRENDSNIHLSALALGNSIGTPPEGITAEVIEVKSLDEVALLGREGVEGKIVFYNRPMDPTQLRTFNAYGGAVDQRVWGASKAAEFGGLGAIVRSMTLKLDDEPHTGTMVYKEENPKVPSMAISTIAANQLSELISKGKTTLTMISDCANVGLRQTHNVIGEIKGSVHPDTIILVGGHLDSWDVGEGAHDDGAGCVHALQVLQTFLDMEYKPRYTIRCVLFANEENGLAGGRTYAQRSNEKGEYHLAALESDAGGFVPRGFSFDGHADVLKPFYARVSKWLPLLEAYGLYFTTGGSGADIGPLKSQKGLLIGLRPDSQRYFDYHHTANDTFEAVNKRELELGAAAMTSLIYLIDKYGLE